MTSPLDIIFMGTPDFAVPCLKKIHETGHRILLVVTQPDRPKGRGKKLVFPPVKKAAIDLDLPVFQPASIKSDMAINRLSTFAPDFLVAVAYGQILPVSILNIPKFCAVNVHGSILPKYRGPAPIQRAIINGENETGICTMKMAIGLDTGDVFLCVKTPISPEDNAQTLHDRLAVMGADGLAETLGKIAENRLAAIPQDNTRATYAPMLTKQDGRIPWQKTAEEINNLIRGVTPWPGAFTFHGEKRLKIFSAITVAQPVSEPPGTVLPGFPDELRVATGKEALSILEIQGASGKRLAIADFLRGYALSPGDLLQ